MKRLACCASSVVQTCSIRVPLSTLRVLICFHRALLAIFALAAGNHTPSTHAAAVLALLKSSREDELLTWFVGVLRHRRR